MVKHISGSRVFHCNPGYLLGGEVTNSKSNNTVRFHLTLFNTMENVRKDSTMETATRH